MKIIDIKASASKSKKGYGKYNKYYDYSSNEDDKS